MVAFVNSFTLLTHQFTSCLTDSEDDMKNFIVDDISSSSDDELFYISTTNKLPSPDVKKKYV